MKYLILLVLFASCAMYKPSTDEDNPYFNIPKHDLVRVELVR